MRTSLRIVGFSAVTIVTAAVAKFHLDMNLIAVGLGLVVAFLSIADKDP